MNNIKKAVIILLFAYSESFAQLAPFDIRLNSIVPSYSYDSTRKAIINRDRRIIINNFNIIGDANSFVNFIQNGDNINTSKAKKALSEIFLKMNNNPIDTMIISWNQQDEEFAILYSEYSRYYLAKYPVNLNQRDQLLYKTNKFVKFLLNNFSKIYFIKNSTKYFTVSIGCFKLNTSIYEPKQLKLDTTKYNINSYTVEWNSPMPSQEIDLFLTQIELWADYNVSKNRGEKNNNTMALFEYIKNLNINLKEHNKEDFVLKFLYNDYDSDEFKYTIASIDATKYDLIPHIFTLNSNGRGTAYAGRRYNAILYWLNQNLLQDSILYTLYEVETFNKIEIVKQLFIKPNNLKEIKISDNLVLAPSKTDILIFDYKQKDFAIKINIEKLCSYEYWYKKCHDENSTIRDIIFTLENHKNPLLPINNLPFISNYNLIIEAAND